MPGDPAPDPDAWTRHARVVLRPADAVECGFSRETAESLFREVLGGRDAAPAAEVRALLDGAGDDVGAATRDAAAAGRRRLFATMAEEMLAYRIERMRVVAAHEAIRLAKINLKRVKSDLSVDVLRVLAAELGWTVREDEEGLTVPVEDLLPYFRRPVVRQLLAAKLVQCGLAPAA